MNRSNVHRRLLEIRKVSRDALDAMAQDDDRQLAQSIDLLDLHLQAIRVETLHDLHVKPDRAVQ